MPRSPRPRPRRRRVGRRGRARRAGGIGGWSTTRRRCAACVAHRRAGLSSRQRWFINGRVRLRDRTGPNGRAWCVADDFESKVVETANLSGQGVRSWRRACLGLRVAGIGIAMCGRPSTSTWGPTRHRSLRPHSVKSLVLHRASRAASSRSSGLEIDSVARVKSTRRPYSP